MTRWPAILVALMALAMAPSLGQAKQDGRGAGGKADEHRSDEARENTNAQWQDDSTRGQERAEERRNEEGGKKEKDGGTEDGSGDVVIKGKKILEN